MVERGEITSQVWNVGGYVWNDGRAGVSSGHRPFIGLLSAFIVGDRASFRARGRRGGVGSFFAQTVERGESR